MTSRARPVVVVSHEARPGGAPMAALEVLRFLEGQGHDYACVLREGGALAGRFPQSRLRYERRSVGRPVRRHPRVRERLRLSRLERRAEESVACSMLDELNPSLVWVNSAQSAAYLRPAVQRGLPCIFYCHEIDPMLARSLDPYGLDAEWERVAALFTSAASLSAFAGRGVQPYIRKVVHPPVDGVRVRALAGDGRGSPVSEGKLVLAACGAVTSHKGPDLFVDVVAEVKQKLPELDVRGVWVGDGPLLRKMQRDLSARGLDGDVRFVGFRENPYPLLAAADVLVVPSREEPLGMVALEGLALGLPVVAFDTGGLREALGEAGVVVPASSTEAMATSVVEVAADASLRADLASRGPERVDRHFGVDGFDAELRALFDEVC